METLLSIADRVGLFRLARYVGRRKLRILCYHGFSYADEHRFRSGLFMAPETFRHRMEILAREGYRVLGLEDALRRVSEGSLQRDSVVLTFDDGWQGIADFAVPVLRQYGFPATIYVTSYYVSTQIPIVNILVPYIFWKAQEGIVDASRILPGRAGKVDLGDPQARQDLSRQLIDYCDQGLSPDERLALCRRCALALGVNIDFIDRGGFRLMNTARLGQIAGEGFDIQLHSHRHRGTLGPPAQTTYEVERNREVLRECTKTPLVHFCYPGGRYSSDQINVLRGLGILSATTTQPGLVDRATSHFELPRFLDEENLSQAKFKALVSGFWSALRSLEPGIPGPRRPPE